MPTKPSKLAEMYCDTCGEDRQFQPTTVTKTLTIRGDPITAGAPMLICPICHTHQPDPSPLADPMAPFYTEFRRQHGLLTPDEIRSIRKSYNLSIEVFAALLGLSPTTLHRYEGGSIQDQAYDNLLRLVADPTNLKHILTQRSPSLPEKWQQLCHRALSQSREHTPTA